MISKIKYISKTKLLVGSLLTIASVSVICGAVVLHAKTNTSNTYVVEMPSNWSKDYFESQYDYDTYVDNIVDWSTVTPTEDQIVTYEAGDTSTSFEVISSPATNSITDKDRSIIMLNENDAWSLVSGGIYKSYPTSSFSANKNNLKKIQQENTETITVKCWYWEDPSDNTNFNKVTVTKTFAVNTNIADLFVHAFEDIYNHPSKPIINIGDKGMGTWVLRGKNHNPNRTMSSHSLGVTIDINPSTGSFCVNGTWYGNAYGQKAMPADVWYNLPETHNKYHVLYKGCPIVEIFKSYGFYWGGDWTSGTDCMHIGFLGDGNNCRTTGQSNYQSRN